MRVRRTIEYEAPNFANKLRQALDESPKAITDVAREIGLKGTQYLYDLMSGKRDSVTYERVKALEKALDYDFGVSLDEPDASDKELE